MAARYGGEEFLVILPACDRAGAEVVAERLRAAIAATSVSFANGTDLPGVTASIGLAQHKGGAESMEQLIAACDEALYRAKRAGRDCISA